MASLPAAGVAASAVAARREAFAAAAHGLRGVAAMMVFAAHILGGTAEHVYAADTGHARAIAPFWNIGTFGVELFFVISGFVILPSVRRYSLGGFAARRAVRLYPLFFLFSLLFVVLNAVTHAYPRLDDPLTIVAGLTFLNLFTGTEQLTPNAWSLSYEVMFYAGAALVWQTWVRERRPWLGWPVAVACAAFVAWFPIALYFLAGMAVRLATDRGWHWPPRLAAVAEPLALAAMLRLAAINHYEYHWADFAQPAVPLLILATAVYFHLAVRPGSLTERLLANRVTLYLGTVSYSLYIVHPYVYLPLRLVFVRMGWFGVDPLVSVALFGLAVTPVMLLATHLVHLGIERWPYTQVFRQTIYHR